MIRCAKFGPRRHGAELAVLDCWAVHSHTYGLNQRSSAQHYEVCNWTNLRTASTPKVPQATRSQLHLLSCCESHTIPYGLPTIRWT